MRALTEIFFFHDKLFLLFQFSFSFLFNKAVQLTLAMLHGRIPFVFPILFELEVGTLADSRLFKIFHEAHSTTLEK